MLNLIKKANPVRSISPVEVRRMLDSNEGFILLDVRAPEEYRAKHIPKSRLLPLDRLEKEATATFPDRNVPMVTYCLTGGRSARAARILNKLGYRNIYNLGGINNWPYETETGPG